MTPPQPPEPLTPERCRELARLVSNRSRRVAFAGEPSVAHKYLEIADALDFAAKVMERCVIAEPVSESSTLEGLHAVMRNEERRAILALLVAAGQRQE